MAVDGHWNVARSLRPDEIIHRFFNDVMQRHSIEYEKSPFVCLSFRWYHRECRFYHDPIGPDGSAADVNCKVILGAGYCGFRYIFWADINNVLALHSVVGVFGIHSRNAAPWNENYNRREKSWRKSLADYMSKQKDWLFLFNYCWFIMHDYYCGIELTFASTAPYGSPVSGFNLTKMRANLVIREFHDRYGDLCKWSDSFSLWLYLERPPRLTRSRTGSLPFASTCNNRRDENARDLLHDITVLSDDATTRLHHNSTKSSTKWTVTVIR